MTGQIRARHFAYFLELVESLETSWNTQLEPLWSNPIGADLANVSAAMMWVLDEGDAEGALRMAVGLDRFWIFSVPPPAVRLAWLEAALDLPWSPSSVVGIRARAKAYHLAGLLKSRADPVAAQGLLEQGLMLFEKIGDQAGAAALHPESWRSRPSRWRRRERSARNSRELGPLPSLS